MMNIPFLLESVPVRDAAKALERLSRERPNTVPVLLGDADVFSTEWAETVDLFEAPERVLDEARDIDIDAWFSAQADQAATAKSQADHKRFPFNIFRRPFQRRAPEPVQPVEDPMIAMLNSQLAQLEKTGEGSEEELDDIRQIIADIEADGTTIFPDPVDYITPRRGDSVAAGLVHAREPWEAAAWLQHGTYAVCAPKPVLVALCKWLWEKHGGRIITASTDHIGFQMERPIALPEDATEVLHRFSALGASEINADHRGTGGSSLVGAPRLWVWWD